MTDISVTEFLEARLSDPVGRGRTDCDGSGEYASCWDWSDWHEGVIAAHRVILADYLKAVEDSRPSGNPTVWGQQARFGLWTAVCALANQYRNHPDWRADW
jgi:hypothetical protein